MFKIWAKIIKDNKIIKDYMYYIDGKFVAQNFQNYLNQICYNLDISTPVVLSSHIQNYINFNHVKFLPTDFMEKVSFDHLILENASL